MEKVIRRSLVPCIMATSHSASIWIGVEEKTLCAIGLPIHMIKKDSFNIAVNAALSSPFPVISPSCVSFYVHPLRRLDVSSFVSPQKAILSPENSLIALQCLLGHAAVEIRRDKKVLVIVEEARLDAVRSLITSKPSSDAWEVGVKTYISTAKPNTRWLNTHNWSPFDDDASGLRFRRA